jgi:hypothetical protein
MLGGTSQVMNDGIKIALIVLTPFLVGGALLYFTRRNRRRQLYLLLPILLVANVWLGFAHGWRRLDLFQLGFFLLWAVVACFLLSRASTRI